MDVPTTSGEKPRRNDPCPCGSGKKYKRCCEGREIRTKTSLTKWTLVAVGILIVLGGVGFVAALLAPNESDTTSGRVWSPEHGHWHDVGGDTSRPTGEPVSQPPGPAPPGKVWSAAHGHWHDAR